MILTGEERQLAVNAARKYLDAFCIATGRYQPAWFHDIILEKLQESFHRVINGENVRLIINMPPRHGKSEGATIRFPAWALGQDPTIPIIVAGYNDSLATDFGLKTRDLMDQQNYQAIFKTRLRPDQKAKGSWGTAIPNSRGELVPAGGGYKAAGIGSGITGRGFKLGIIDDFVKDREEADSLLMRNKVWDWYKDVFYTRREGVSAIIIVVTRWHNDDLVGRLLEKEREDREAGVEHYDKWEVIKFPAIAEEEEVFGGEIRRHAGQALWPEKFSIDELKSARNTLGEYGFASLYQQNPLTSMSQEFTKDMFKYYNESEIRGKVLESHTLVDLNHSENTSAHNGVIRTVSKVRGESAIYLREETAGHLNPLQTIDAIFYHQEKYRSKVWVEGVGYQRALKAFIEEEMRRRNVFFIINLLKRNSETSKVERIRGLIPYYRTGVVYHRDNGEDGPLEREMIQWPQGLLDDRVDCLANFLEAFNPTTIIKPKKKIIHRPDSPFGG